MIRAVSICKDYHVGHKTKRVLDNVNFEVRSGERLGILGRNGAGKSTLVRIMGGVEHPTSGRVERTMTQSWPLGLSGGFQGSLTGYDNIKFIARLYDKPLDEIRLFVEDFSELGQHLRAPVKVYSSGMRARLAFGLSLAIDFDCYLIDEVIMVGDQRFHRRCRYEIFEKRPDRALMLISHDVGVINEYCNAALVLHGGRSKVFLDVQLAVDIYTGL